jgi:hypothetical protein
MAGALTGFGFTGVFGMADLMMPPVVLPIRGAAVLYPCIPIISSN